MTERTPHDITVPHTVRVRIDFHGPFRVGTGTAAGGVDITAHLDDPLPASSLKGVMRASATQLMPAARQLVDRVFGAGRQPSPWHWSGADFDEAPRAVNRARIAVDGTTGTAQENHLLLAQELWAKTASFTVTRTAYLPPDVAADHVTVLACAAAGVHAVGGQRRRGLGWVTCTPIEPALDDALLARFEELRSRHHA